MIKKITQLLVIATVSTFSLAAQGGPGGIHEMRGAGLGADAVQNSADAIARRITFLTSLLTLTTAQASEATSIFTNAATTVGPLQTELSTARTSLREAVRANNTSAIDQFSTQIGTLTGRIAAAQNRADAAFYALLTAEQRTRFDAVGGGRGRGGRH